MKFKTYETELAKKNSSLVECCEKKENMHQGKSNIWERCKKRTKGFGSILFAYTNEPVPHSGKSRHACGF